MNHREAKYVLNQAGYVTLTPDRLRVILTAAYDPIIKKACDILLTVVQFRRKP